MLVEKVGFRRSEWFRLPYHMVRLGIASGIPRMPADAKNSIRPPPLESEYFLAIQT